MSAPIKIRKSAALLVFLLTSSLVGGIAGCANPGPPKPPTLRLPEQAKAFTAERVGDHVLLSWQTSSKTTDGLATRGPITAQICRDDAPKPPTATPAYPIPANPCRIVRELIVPASTPENPTLVVDRLTPELMAGEPRLMEYRVTLSNAKGRSIGASAPVYALAGAAPSPVGPLEVEPVRNGALVRWKPTKQAPMAPMELTRTLLANATGAVEPPKRDRAGRPSGGVASAGKPAGAGTLPLLTLTSEGELKADAGGMVDHGIHDGDTLEYVAQRVLRMQFTPPKALTTSKKGTQVETSPAAETFELKSEVSPAVTFIFHDVIPPIPPSELVALTGGGFGEPASIDLSWEPNAELDLLGYNVYRAGIDSRFARINTGLVKGPEYRDTTVEVGKSYVYRVTAVDQHLNESKASTAVKAAVRR